MGIKQKVQELLDTIEEEYGVKAAIDIYIHTSNNRLNENDAKKITREIANEYGSPWRQDFSKDAFWFASDLEKRVHFTAFYEFGRKTENKEEKVAI